MLSAGGRWPSGGKLAHRTRNLVAKAKETSADKLNRPVSKYFPTGISALSVHLWVFVVALVYFKLGGEHTDLTASVKNLLMILKMKSLLNIEASSLMVLNTTV